MPYPHLDYKHGQSQPSNLVGVCTSITIAFNTVSLHAFDMRASRYVYCSHTVSSHGGVPYLMILREVTIPYNNADGRAAIR